MTFTQRTQTLLPHGNIPLQLHNVTNDRSHQRQSLIDIFNSQQCFFSDHVFIRLTSEFDSINGKSLTADKIHNTNHPVGQLISIATHFAEAPYFSDPANSKGLGSPFTQTA